MQSALPPRMLVRQENSQTTGISRPESRKIMDELGGKKGRIKGK